MEPGSEPGSEPALEIDAGDTRWRFDRAFLTSRWTCIWGQGCLGILPHPAPERGQGCCSLGAELDGEDEARMISALAATLDPSHFQYHPAATDAGVLTHDGDGDGAAGGRINTRVVDGACVFLNRPGFAGGAGCALHLAAVDAGESPVEWKPSVCWQLPIKVDWEPVDTAGHPALDGDADGDGDGDADGGPAEIATVRAWTRADWGAEGETMAWCCTEGDLAYQGDRPVVESLAAELEAIVGTTVYVELRRRLAENC